MTSFFRFVNKQVIYRLGIISLAHAPVHTFKPGNKIIKLFTLLLMFLK